MERSPSATRPNSTVRLSRIVQLPWAIALGLSVTVGLGVFTLLGEFVTLTARKSAPIYVVFVFFSLPFILTFWERAVSVPGSGGAYQFSRTNRFLWHRFFSGWLLLGGYAVLIALLAWGMGYYLEVLYIETIGADPTGAATMGALPFDRKWLAAAGIVLTALFTLVIDHINWRRRLILTIIAVGSLLLIALMGTIAPSSVGSSINQIASGTLVLESVTLMMASLWGLYLVLGVRAQLTHPTKNMGWALGLPVVGLGVVGALAGLSVSLYGGPLLYPKLPMVDVINSLGYLPVGATLLLYLLSGLTIIFLAANRALGAGSQLLGNMSRDGFVPERMRFLGDLDNPAMPAIVLGSLIGLLLVLFVPFRNLVGLGAVTFLWSAAFIHLPDLFYAEPNLPPRRPFKLPFHPLFPGLTVAAGLLLPFGLPWVVWIGALVWSLAGILFYVFYARKHGQTSRRQQVVVDDDLDEDVENAGGAPDAHYPPVEPTAPYANVIVGIGNPQTAGSLLRLASAVAKSRDGHVIALRIIDLPEYGNQAGWQKAAHLEWTTLSEQLSVYDYGVPIRTNVRLAPSYADGIMEAVREEKAGWLLVGWTGDVEPLDDDLNVKSLAGERIDTEPILNELVAYADCNVGILRGVLPDEVDEVVVTTAGGPHAVSGLKLADALLEDDDSKLQLITVARGTASSELTAAAEDMLEQTLTASAIEDRTLVATHVINAPTVAGGVANRFRDADLLIVGASKVQIPERSQFGGLAKELIEQDERPALLVRKVESVRFPSLRRARNQLVDRLPTLTPERKETVLRQMRSDAVPSVDFFILILLSSVIASLGLLQNSGAVIIGAMLVAPLMSPILATGMGMAVGEPKTVRLGFESTLKGMVLAVVVGAVIVIISPLDAPTNEILARTSPNVLDLMIALASGAAAGYAVSRKEVAAALPGVAIAAALVPPLCVVGYGIGVSHLEIAAGALLLFLTNLTAIVFAAALTFLALGFHPPDLERGQMIRTLRTTVISLVLITVVLLAATRVTVRQEKTRTKVEETFAGLIDDRNAQVVDLNVERQRNRHFIAATVITYPNAGLDAEDLDTLEEDLETAVGSPVDMDITVIQAWRDDLVNIDKRALVLEMLDAAMTERGAKVQESNATYAAGRYRIDAEMLVYESHTLSEAFLDELSADLSEAVDAPVSLNATFLEAVQFQSSSPTPVPPSETE